MPPALCRTRCPGSTPATTPLAELEILVGYDDDLAGEVTRIANQIRGLLTQIHPPLERVLGPKLQHPAVLKLLSQCGGPPGYARPAARNCMLADSRPGHPPAVPSGPR
jgi:hypothetical protein